jgi:tyrosyl-tRNA synthetase
MPKVVTDEKRIDEVLTRGVEHAYPSREALKKVLCSGKRLKIYNGIDPTGKLHLGHAVVLRKLRQFQDLGHDIIVLIGDFTARIGDPTDKTATRKQLTRAEVQRNARGYRQVIGKILDLKKSNVRFLHNERWTNRLKPSDMLELASYFTVSRLLERDMFQKRLKEGREIRVHEFLYPIFQAYDSVTMDVDMEIGGNDQTFNMLAGRTLLQKLKGKEKFVLTTKLLTDPEGKKMGKTEGVVVKLDEPAANMYGQIMALPDALLATYFTLCTSVDEGELRRVERALGSGAVNPRDVKMRLAREVVTLAHDAASAKRAEASFVRTFQRRELPDAIPVLELSERPRDVGHALVAAGGATSVSAARQLIAQGGVKINRVVVTDPHASLPTTQEFLISRGKRFFRRVRFKK